MIVGGGGPELSFGPLLLLSRSLRPETDVDSINDILSKLIILLEQSVLVLINNCCEESRETKYLWHYKLYKL